MTQRWRNRFLTCFLILLGILCLCGVLWACALEAVDQELSTQIKKWWAERWLNSTYKDVYAITDDEKLVESQEPEVTEGGTMRCIRAAAAQAFGTDRPYADVVEDYVSWLKKKGWHAGDIPEDSDTPITHIFFIPDGRFSRTFVIYPYQPEEPVDFATIYVVQLYFTELRCTDLCPAWRCPN